MERSNCRVERDALAMDHVAGIVIGHRFGWAQLGLEGFTWADLAEELMHIQHGG